MNDINEVSILKGKEIYQDVILEKGYFFLDDVNGFDVVSVNVTKYLERYLIIERLTI